jgi:hypothetical protein
MALVLIKEDGTAKSNANSYATATDGDGYHDGHLYASAWTAATQARKEAALVMATRLLDSQFQFNGFRAHAEQALQWPREKCPDPDASVVSISVFGWVGDNFVEPDLVPAAVVQATCELGRELLLVDRTAAPEGEGIAQFGIAGGVSVTFDKADRRALVPPLVVAMLGKFGCLVGAGSGAVRLRRT